MTMAAADIINVLIVGDNNHERRRGGLAFSVKDASCGVMPEPAHSGTLLLFAGFCVFHLRLPAAALLQGAAASNNKHHAQRTLRCCCLPRPSSLAIRSAIAAAAAARMPAALEDSFPRAPEEAPQAP